MKAVFKAGIVLLACALVSNEAVVAQPANLGCTSEWSGTIQKLHCAGGVTIVVESGAGYTLLDRSHKGRVDAVELNSKALLIEVPPKSGGNGFQVITPQAIAAVRGTKWAVDAAEARTSVFVVNGQVAVGTRTGSQERHPWVWRRSGRRSGRSSHCQALGSRSGIGLDGTPRAVSRVANDRTPHPDLDCRRIGGGLGVGRLFRA